MNNPPFGTFDIQERAEHARDNILATSCLSIHNRDVREWMLELSQTHQHSFMEAYYRMSALFTSTEEQSDKYFEATLQAAALLYLEMERIKFDSKDPKYFQIVYLFAFYVGTLQARVYHQLKMTQERSRRTKASRPRSAKLEAQFEFEAMTFIETRTYSLGSRFFAALVRKLEEDVNFISLLEKYHCDAKKIHEESLGANNKAMIALSARQKTIKGRSKNSNAGKSNIPSIENPKIPDSHGLYVWLLNRDKSWKEKIRRKFLTW